jgi:hypothetical protein
MLGSLASVALSEGHFRWRARSALRQQVRELCSVLSIQRSRGPCRADRHGNGSGKPTSALRLGKQSERGRHRPRSGQDQLALRRGERSACEVPWPS